MKTIIRHGSVYHFVDSDTKEEYWIPDDPRNRAYQEIVVPVLSVVVDATPPVPGPPPPPDPGTIVAELIATLQTKGVLAPTDLPAEIRAEATRLKGRRG